MGCEGGAAEVFLLKNVMPTLTAALLEVRSPTEHTAHANSDALYFFISFCVCCSIIVLGSATAGSR